MKDEGSQEREKRMTWREWQERVNRLLVILRQFPEEKLTVIYWETLLAGMTCWPKEMFNYSPNCSSLFSVLIEDEDRAVELIAAKLGEDGGWRYAAARAMLERGEIGNLKIEIRKPEEAPMLVEG